MFLFIVACVAGNPSSCIKDKITLDNPRACSQITLAQWIESHPNYVIKKYTCSPVDKEDI